MKRLYTSCKFSKKQEYSFYFLFANLPHCTKKTGFHLKKAMNYACAIGALVAGQEGANPKISDIEIRKYMMLKDKKIEK